MYFQRLIAFGQSPNHADGVNQTAFGQSPNDGAGVNQLEHIHPDVATVVTIAGPLCTPRSLTHNKDHTDQRMRGFPLPSAGSLCPAAHRMD